ncbi:Thioesterase/thiol ester dehydrase-isomerase [Penicillium longicatenatum]|uniref:Thioesterase/thiol ester dehydrase-isomerase n=1 Tax=Penicillium longicatenatum TaxID=1561947 RepID=UPI00254710C0|nr:Thioesterase/thiol ester dehydrase-isomerase [Penicillium longicatenatum]KAJ5631145.1 Thioesterase/thiol ester dehydrase-isomerase [Penicillium longicatenatum]
MGNDRDIAYGGCTLSIAVNAAFQTVSSGYHLYSVLGNYLGPALTNRKLHCTVRRVRDTRTFATRQVDITQEYENNTQRPCLTIIADFQVQERGSMLTYSSPPVAKYSDIDSSPTRQNNCEAFLRTGDVSSEMLQRHDTLFGLMSRFFEQKPIPDGVTNQTLHGIGKHLRTTQDHLSLTSKTSAEWMRSKSHIETESQQLSALAFYMDEALAFLPLTHSHLFFEDASACASLDIALRLFSNKIDLNEWLLKEMKTISGGEGRTYSEARLWDQNGNLVACMTQQNILRPHKL